MAKLISKCCVCGRIYFVITCDMAGLGEHEERYSHGFCSKACGKAEFVSVLFWDTSFNCINMDKGNILNNELFFRGERQSHYLTHRSKDKLPEEFKQEARENGTIILCLYE